LRARETIIKNKINFMATRRFIVKDDVLVLAGVKINDPEHCSSLKNPYMFKLNNKGIHIINQAKDREPN
jgi:hypothetical protein